MGYECDWDVGLSYAAKDKKTVEAILRTHGVSLMAGGCCWRCSGKYLKKYQ